MVCGIFVSASPEGNGTVCRLGWVAAVIAGLFAVSGPAGAQQPDKLETCSEVHAYCMQLCGHGVPTPPADWKCEANRCNGLQECLATGIYKMGTQYGHRPPRRTDWGPFQKK